MNLSWITDLFSKKKEEDLAVTQWVIDGLVMGKRHGLTLHQLSEVYNLSVEEISKILHGR